MTLAWDSNQILNLQTHKDDLDLICENEPYTLSNTKIDPAKEYGKTILQSDHQFLRNYLLVVKSSIIKITKVAVLWVTQSQHPFLY